MIAPIKEARRPNNPERQIPIARNREDLPSVDEAMQRRFGVGLERLGTQRRSGADRLTLLREMEEKAVKEGRDPREVQSAMQQVERNVAQIEKKESFLKKMLMFPIRHPFLTLAGTAGGVLLLQYLGFNALGAFSGLAKKVPFGKMAEYIRSFMGLGGASKTIAGGRAVESIMSGL